VATACLAIFESVGRPFDRLGLNERGSARDPNLPQPASFAVPDRRLCGVRTDCWVDGRWTGSPSLRERDERCGDHEPEDREARLQHLEARDRAHLVLQLQATS
jgi:hypothetical protein